MDHVLQKLEPRQVTLWGQHTVKLRHQLADNPLFSDTSIATLIDTVDQRHIKIETMPDDGFHVRAWSACERTGLSGAQVLEAVRRGRIWIELKALEEIDQRFADVLDVLYGELEAGMSTPQRTFRTFKRKLNLLVSSPGARVFYHFDVPGQTLVQLRGRKRIWIYPPTPPFLWPENLENTVRSVATEGLDYHEWFDDYAEVHDMAPGDLLHWALNGPHRVANHDELSVSLTTEHWTPAVRRSYALHYGNGILRAHARWRPRSQATTGAAFWAKAAMTAAWRSSGMQAKQSYRWVPGHCIDPDAPNCVRPIQPRDLTPARRLRRRQLARGLVKALGADPVGVLRALPGHVRMQLRRKRSFVAEESWNQALHHLLGAPWPCPEGERVTALLADIAARLADCGLAFGRHTYGGYSDSDESLARAVWCAVRHTAPDVAVETGVARGVTSRIVLEALNENNRGRLWSIDLPHPFDHSLHAQTGAALTGACRPRWTYVEGSSRQRLPDVVREVGQIGVFIHDSLHTAKNTRFEMDEVAAVIRPGGIMLIDDISTHDGFTSFARDHPDYQTIICPSADRVGLFGIAVNRQE